MDKEGLFSRIAAALMLLYAGHYVGIIVRNFSKSGSSEVKFIGGIVTIPQLISIAAIIAMGLMIARSDSNMPFFFATLGYLGSGIYSIIYMESKGGSANADTIFAAVIIPILIAVTIFLVSVNDSTKAKISLFTGIMPFVYYLFDFWEYLGKIAKLGGKLKFSYQLLNYVWIGIFLLIALKLREQAFYAMGDEAQDWTIPGMFNKLMNSSKTSSEKVSQDVIDTSNWLLLGVSVADEIYELNFLLEDGYITEDEFNRMRSRILGKNPVNQG